MNILPKKRWHVRTKDNIARVRRDEAKAKAEDEERQRRVQLAEQEARTALLRSRARSHRPLEDNQKDEDEKRHVNLFEDLERGETTSAANPDREAEEKRQREEEEKKIGLLTYLGQDTQELTGETSWWQKAPSDNAASTSKDDAGKERMDPLNDIRGYLGCDGVKSVSKKRHKSSSKKKKKKKSKKRKKSRYASSSSDDEGHEQIAKKRRLEKLRAERLQREKVERAKAETLLYGKKEEETLPERLPPPSAVEDVDRKYNSQFNPHIAKQNKLKAGEKYWLN